MLVLKIPEVEVSNAVKYQFSINGIFRVSFEISANKL